MLAPLLLLLRLDLGRGLGVAGARLLPAVMVLEGRPPSLGDKQAVELRLRPGPLCDMRPAPGAKLPPREVLRGRKRHMPRPGRRVLPWSDPSRRPELGPGGLGGEPMSRASRPQ